jgi:AraC family transcriptional activator of pobA
LGLFFTRRLHGRKLTTTSPGTSGKFINRLFQQLRLNLERFATVTHLAGALNIFVKYLSILLKVKVLTGQSNQQHIYKKVIEKAIEKLFTTNLSASEMAYELGFEHPQSFSRLFKIKT